MLKKIIIGALLLFCAAFAAFWIFIMTVPIGEFKFSDDARIKAETAFYDELATYDCLTDANIRDVAARRDWLVTNHDSLRWCTSGENIGDWISVQIEPAFSFSTEDENNRYFGFDAQGCSVDWEYASCD